MLNYQQYGLIEELPGAATAAAPAIPPPWRFNQAEQPAWQARPLAAATLVLLTAVTFFGAPGQAPAKAWRFNVAEEIGWVGKPSASATIGLLAHQKVYGAPGQVPTKSWRYDFDAQLPQWIGQPIDSAPLQLLTAQKVYGAGGQVPTKVWRADVDAPPAPWNWQPSRASALLNSTATQQPFAYQWRYDYAADTPWLGTPIRSAVLAQLLTAAGQPPQARWNFGYDETPAWLGRPAHSALLAPLLTAAGQAPAYRWNFGYDESSGWRLNGVYNSNLLAKATAPFAGTFAPPVAVDEPGWLGRPLHSALLAPLLTAAGQATSFRWNFGVPELEAWRAPWVRPLVVFAPVASAAPFVPVSWQFNSLPDVAWSWQPPAVLFLPSSSQLLPDPRFISAARNRLTASPVRSRNQTVIVRARKFATTLGLPMPQGPDFSQMDVGEIVTGAIDFSNWLPAGVTIATIASVVASNYLPPSGAAFVTLSGASSIGTVPTSEGGSGIANMAVLQKWTGVNPGTARITVTITTSDGQTLIGWAHQSVGQPN